MTVEPQQFRHALSRFASGVTVISTVSPDGAPLGMTVSAFSSLSLSPPLILICLDNATSHLRAYTDGPSFVVNILSEDQQAVSNTFAFSGPIPPFETTPYDLGTLGLPVIRGTSATLECHRKAVYPGGDHVIVIGEVMHAVWDEGREPLVYVAGSYRKLVVSDTSS